MHIVIAADVFKNTLDEILKRTKQRAGTYVWIEAYEGGKVVFKDNRVSLDIMGTVIDPGNVMIKRINVETFRKALIETGDVSVLTEDKLICFKQNSFSLRLDRAVLGENDFKPKRR